MFEIRDILIYLLGHSIFYKLRLMADVAYWLLAFTPQPLRLGWWREKGCPCCISETVRCSQFILGWDIGQKFRCAKSWCDLDLTFDLAVVTLSLKILYGLYLGNH